MPPALQTWRQNTHRQLTIITSVSLQIIGAIFGALLVAGLIPEAHIGMGDGAPGCFDDTVIGKGLTHSQLFGWEVVMTFTLISVVYACGVAKPGHGSFTPLVVGLSLVACAGTGALRPCCL
jgi:glycerol uptake facilitator-like aquaporin